MCLKELGQESLNTDPFCTPREKHLVLVDTRHRGAGSFVFMFQRLHSVEFGFGSFRLPDTDSG